MVRAATGMDPVFSLTRAKENELGGKQNSKGGEDLLPKFLLGRDNSNMDMHGHRLCFNYQQASAQTLQMGASVKRMASMLSQGLPRPTT